MYIIHIYIYDYRLLHIIYNYTLPETNMAPENGWLEDKPFLFQKPYVQGQTVGFREGIYYYILMGVPLIGAILRFP